RRQKIHSFECLLSSLRSLCLCGEITDQWFSRNSLLLTSAHIKSWYRAAGSLLSLATTAGRTSGKHSLISDSSLADGLRLSVARYGFVMASSGFRDDDTAIATVPLLGRAMASLMSLPFIIISACTMVPLKVTSLPSSSPKLVISEPSHSFLRFFLASLDSAA